MSGVEKMVLGNFLLILRDGKILTVFKDGRAIEVSDRRMLSVTRRQVQVVRILKPETPHIENEKFIEVEYYHPSIGAVQNVVSFDDLC
jgi:hypothetical protein